MVIMTHIAERPDKDNWEWDDTDDITESRKRKRDAQKQRHKETSGHGFGCDHCNEWVPIDESIGTHNRNHCPHCLWSKHMDADKPGDRKSDCKSGMKPVALTFKGEAMDKYAGGDTERRLGELMLVHECTAGDRVRINRIAADDSTDALLNVYNEGHRLSEETQESLRESGIEVAPPELSHAVMTRLFGSGEYA